MTHNAQDTDWWMIDDAGSRREQLRLDMNQYGVPDHLHFGLRRYLLGRQPVDGFLMAVLSNDLVIAVCTADANSLAGLREIVKFVLNHTPSVSHGSPEAVRQWTSTS